MRTPAQFCKIIFSETPPVPHSCDFFLSQGWDASNL
jgi:hypothetical protein